MTYPLDRKLDFLTVNFLSFYISVFQQNQSYVQVLADPLAINQGY